jgi:hypothetical protein
MIYFGLVEKDYIEAFWDDYCPFFDRLIKDTGTFIPSIHLRKIKLKNNPDPSIGMSWRFLQSVGVKAGNYKNNIIPEKDILLLNKDTARTLYFFHFFNPAYLKLRDKNLARILFKFGLEVGRKGAIKVLQEAMNRLLKTQLFKLDGYFSVDLLKSCNTVFNPDMLFEMFLLLIFEFNEDNKPGTFKKLFRAFKNWF